MTIALRTLPWIFAVILLHLVMARTVTSIELNRALGSLLPLSLMFIGSGAIADLLARSSVPALIQVARRALVGLLAIGLWGAIGTLQPFAASFSKPVFPFSEPSHFALVLTPVMIFACVTSPVRTRVVIIMAALVETALLQNLTLGVGCLLTAMICLRKRDMLIGLALLVPALSLIDLSYYVDRLDFSGGGQNLSNLVFLQGWQLIDESWQNTHGIGLGFQQLGLLGTDVPAADLIHALLHDEDLNLLDGGFTLSKILGEFGVAGLTLVVAYAFAFVRAASNLRAAAAGLRALDPALIMAASLIVGYSLEMVVRGAGYFTPTTMLMLSALWIWRRPPAPVLPQGANFLRAGHSTPSASESISR